jgi:putative MATE family efflux protein
VSQALSATTEPAGAAGPAGLVAGAVEPLVRLALPAIAHLWLTTLSFMADRVLVGRQATSALASMQISTTLLWCSCSTFAALAVGAMALVGRLWGARRKVGAARAALVAIAAAIAVGIAVTAPLVVLGPRALLVLFPGTEPAVLVQAEAYLAITLPFLPLVLAEAVAAACLQAAGDTRTPLWAALGGNAVDLALSLALVPQLGVRGAAVGSAAGFVVAALWLFGALASDKSPLPMRAALRGAFRPCLCGRLGRVTLPALGERVAYHGAYLVYAALVGGLGASAMAAHQALLGIEALGYQTAAGLGVAAGALAAQRLGAGRAREAAAACAAAVALGVGLLCLSAAAFALCPDALLGVVSRDGDVVELGAAAMPVAAFAQPFMALATVGAIVLRSAGATRAALAVTLLGAVVVRLGATWLFVGPLDLGLRGAWLGSAADWLVQALVLGWLLARGRWRRERV